jgi:hypothetical protein
VEALRAGFVSVPDNRHVIVARLRAASPTGSSAIKVLDNAGWKRLHPVIWSARLNIHCECALGGRGEHKTSEDPKITDRMYSNASVLWGATHSAFRAMASLAHSMECSCGISGMETYDVETAKRSAYVVGSKRRIFPSAPRCTFMAS